MSSILVTYTTRYGSTKEVAERIGHTLRDRGALTEVRPVDAVDDLSRYDEVVFGAPYYIGKMLKPAGRFLESHRSELEQLPVAIFALGPLSAEDDQDEAREQLDKTLAEMDWLHPVAAEMFIGKYDPAALRGLDKLVTKPKASPLHGLGARDDRDWEAIERWAASLPLA